MRSKKYRKTTYWATPAIGPGPHRRFGSLREALDFARERANEAGEAYVVWKVVGGRPTVDWLARIEPAPGLWPRIFVP
jgi:hypothetical protein